MGDIIGIEEMQVSSEAHNLELTIAATVDFTNAFQIRTKMNGYNGGRSYFLRSETEGGLASLIQGFAFIAEGAGRKARAQTGWAIARERARSLYNSSGFQSIAAFLILAVSFAIVFLHVPLSERRGGQNFGITILEAQLQTEQLYQADGSATLIKQALDSANTGFTALFTLELLLNLFCHWLRDFASNSWCPCGLLFVPATIQTIHHA
jgi:hypothetical protein